jgi:hypothetical protein
MCEFNGMIGDGIFKTHILWSCVVTNILLARIILFNSISTFGWKSLFSMGSSLKRGKSISSKQKRLLWN